MIKTQLIGLVAHVDACWSQVLLHRNPQFLIEEIILSSRLDDTVGQTIKILQWPAISREEVIAMLFESVPVKMRQAHNTSNVVLRALVPLILKD